MTELRLPRVPPPSRLFVFALLFGLAVMSSGCATTMGFLWPDHIGSSIRQRELGQRGHQTRSVQVELEPSGHVLACREESRYREVQIETTVTGLDIGSRLAIGFIGLGEMLFGALAMGFAAEPGVAPEEAWPVGIGGGLLAGDGLTALLLAILLPDVQSQQVEWVPGSWAWSQGCSGTTLLLGQTEIRPDAEGRFELSGVVDPEVWRTLRSLTILTAGQAHPLPLTLPQRCALATAAGIPLAECQAPTPVRPQVGVPAPSPVAPPQLRFDVNVSVGVEVGPGGASVGVGVQGAGPP